MASNTTDLNSEEWTNLIGFDPTSSDSGFSLKGLTDILSGKSSYGVAGQLLGLGGIGSLLNNVLGASSNTGYQPKIPSYTATRNMLPIPQTVAAPTAENPQAVAPRRPGSGGVTYFSPMVYTPKANGGLIGYAGGGIASLGSYSDGGQLLKGPGDGVSDSIPATIGGTRPARLADGEFVIPARIVSELGNGSTDAGARKLYEMMNRVKKARSKAKNIAANTKAEKYLPA